MGLRTRRFKDQGKAEGLEDQGGVRRIKDDCGDKRVEGPEAAAGPEVKPGS